MARGAGKRSPSSQPLRLHGVIARDIGIRILSGEHAPGEILSGEVAASGTLRVSRTAYREAVRILAAKGLIESRPKTGTRVSPMESWHLLDPDVLAWLFEIEPDDLLVANLFELRRIVEPEAAALAAQRRTDEHLRVMSRALDDMAAFSLATEEGRLADQQFHAALLNATGNVFLVSLTSGVGAAVSWTTIFKQRHGPLTRDPIPDHRAVYDAVAAQDVEAARAAMTALVDLALHDTKSSLRPRVHFARDRDHARDA